jgi:hypothetical protein
MTSKMDFRNGIIITVSYLVDNSATLSMRSSPFKNAAKPFIEHNITFTQASTIVTSNFKQDKNDAWLINKTNNKITNQSYQKSLNGNASGNAAVPIKRSAKGIENPCESSEGFKTLPPKGWTIINSDILANDIVQSEAWQKEGSYSFRFDNYAGKLNKKIILDYF